MTTEPGERRGMALHTKILLGLALGAAAGVVSNIMAAGRPEFASRVDWVVENLAQPAGQIFLRMLFMIVVPLVFCSITMGVASIGDIKRVGRIGGKTLLFFMFTTAIAVVVGLTLVNVIRPGHAISPDTRDSLMAEFRTEAEATVGAAETSRFGINTFVSIVPRNPVGAAANGDMLGLIFFALIFGIAMTKLPRPVAEPMLNVLEGVNQTIMVIIGFAMALAPIGVFGLIFAVTAKFGLEVLKSLGLFVVMVLLALAIHQFIVLVTMTRILTGIRPLDFIKRIRALMITAFSTSSSNATLPTTIKTAEEGFGVPREVAGFVLPLGATMNMNGTALFEGMTVLFLAQVFGVGLGLPMQILVVVMAVITAIGVAGVPSGSIPLIVVVLGMVGVPGAAIAIVLGVDRIMDMARTVPNVTGDLLTSMVIAKSEGLWTRENEPPEEPRDL